MYAAPFSSSIIAKRRDGHCSRTVSMRHMYMALVVVELSDTATTNASLDLFWVLAGQAQKISVHSVAVDDGILKENDSASGIESQPSVKLSFGYRTISRIQSVRSNKSSYTNSRTPSTCSPSATAPK